MITTKIIALTLLTALTFSCKKKYPDDSPLPSLNESPSNNQEYNVRKIYSGTDSLNLALAYEYTFDEKSRIQTVTQYNSDTLDIKFQKEYWSYSGDTILIKGTVFTSQDKKLHTSYWDTVCFDSQKRLTKIKSFGFYLNNLINGRSEEGLKRLKEIVYPYNDSIFAETKDYENGQLKFDEKYMIDNSGNITDILTPTFYNLKYVSYLEGSRKFKDILINYKLGINGILRSANLPKESYYAAPYEFKKNYTWKFDSEKKPVSVVIAENGAKSYFRFEY